MFGIKNPGKMLGLLKMMGVEPTTLLTGLEAKGVEKWHELQADAGANLTAVAVLDDTGTHFVVSLYKIEENNTLTLWRSFPLKNIEALLSKLSNNDTSDVTPEQIAATIDNGHSRPDAGNGPARNDD